MERRATLAATAACLTLGGAAAAQDCVRWFRRPDAPWAASAHTLAFDAVRGGVVAFDAADGPGGDEAWRFDGESWSLLAGPAPPDRFGHVMAADERRGRIVVFGGGSSRGFLGDTWEWDGGSWRRASDHGPPRMAAHAAAYDATRGVVVLFGGSDEHVRTFGDTWEWDGSGWSFRSGEGPPPRAGHAMAFDRRRGVTVLHGGVGQTPHADTWEWDGSAWKRRDGTGPGPGARSAHAMAEDRARGRALLFGGTRGGVVRLDDTWAWDGARWSEVRSPARPPARMLHAMAYDAGRGVVVLHGGESDRPLRDTWEYGLYPDCDAGTGAGALDIFDLLCFAHRFEKSDPYACGCDESAGPGVCDALDLLCFIAAWESCR